MGKYLTKIETDFLLKAVNLTDCKITLDVGAEAGRFSLLAAQNQTEVVGIDIDPYGLKRLRLKNKNVNTVRADARAMPLREQTLNAALMIEVLDYIPELNEALAEGYRILKPGGCLILSFGNNASIKSRLRSLRERGYQHSYRNVTRTLKNAGFQIKRKTGYNWLPFNRISESSFIPLLTTIERLFCLRRICRYSPWVLIHATKPAQ